MSWPVHHLGCCASTALANASKRRSSSGQMSEARDAAIKLFGNTTKGQAAEGALDGADSAPASADEEAKFPLWSIGVPVLGCCHESQEQELVALKWVRFHGGTRGSTWGGFPANMDHVLESKVQRLINFNRMGVLGL